MKKLNLGLGFLVLISASSFAAPGAPAGNPGAPQNNGTLLVLTPTPVPKVLGNPNLKACLNPIQATNPDGSPIAYDVNGIPNLNNVPNTAFTCQEVLPDSNTDHWNDYLTDSNGKQITGGLYTSKGVFCSDIHDGKTPDAVCNIEKRSLYVIKCPQDGRTRVINGKRMCNTFATIAVYNSIIEKVIPKGSIPLKSVITGVNGGPPAVETPISTFMSVKYGASQCPNNGIVLGRNDDGSPQCDGGTLQNTANTALGDATSALQQINALKTCITETASVNAGTMVCTSPTNSCTPQYCKYRLAGAAHSTDACTAAGGTIMNLNGTPATLPVTTDQATFCQMNASVCPTGWNQMKDSNGNWWTDTTEGNTLPAHDSQTDANCQVQLSYDGNGQCQALGNTCNIGSSSRASSGHHTWGAAWPEVITYYYANGHGWWQGSLIGPTPECQCQNANPPFTSVQGSPKTCAAGVNKVGCW